VRRCIVILVVLLAACTSDDPFAALPEPDPVELESTTTTAAADLAGVPLPPVRGSTTTTIAFGPGPMTIVGKVEGPEGVVGGALVELERLVGDASVMTRVPTAPDGTWNLANVLGGRYRVRAWRVPDLASRAQVVFIESTRERAVELRVEPVGGVRIDTAVAPDPPIVDEQVNLKVRVAERSVDGEGIVRDTPRSGVSVALGGSGRWQTDSPNPSTTADDGTTTFLLTCEDEGVQPLFATLTTGESYALTISPCVDPSSTTTAPSSSSTSSTGSTTSTTEP
jgi:hypothetical protein